MKQVKLYDKVRNISNRFSSLKVQKCEQTLLEDFDTSLFQEFHFLPPLESTTYFWSIKPCQSWFKSNNSVIQVHSLNSKVRNFQDCFLIFLHIKILSSKTQSKLSKYHSSQLKSLCIRILQRSSLDRSPWALLLCPQAFYLFQVIDMRKTFLQGTLSFQILCWLSWLLIPKVRLLKDYYPILKHCLTHWVVLTKKLHFGHLQLEEKSFVSNHGSLVNFSSFFFKFLFMPKVWNLQHFWTLPHHRSLEFQIKKDWLLNLFFKQVFHHHWSSQIIFTY